MEAIILAGGLGTRLQGVIGAYPKCMAPVNEQPFLHYLHQYLQQQNVTRIIHSLGFKSEIVIDYLQQQNITGVTLDYVLEEEPLGTGGGIVHTMKAAQADHVLVLNGDTYFNIDLQQMMLQHLQSAADTSIALKPMHQFDRYGTVTLEGEKIIGFEEKKPMENGLINGGVYCINRMALMKTAVPEKFSFETLYLPHIMEQQKLAGFIYDAYFIDIGVPDDYSRAQQDFKTLFS